MAARARVGGGPDHVCAAPGPPARPAPVAPAARETPVVPAARMPPAAEGPPEPPPHHPPEQPLYHPPDRAAPHPTVPTPRLPPEARDEPFGEPTADDAWWPPEEHLDDLYRAGKSALPPTVVGLTDEEPDGVRRVPRAAEPEPPSRYLPVHVPRPSEPEPRANRWLPLAAAGVVVVLLGAGAVIAGVSR
ncbi:tetratricopeptide repeat protein, partial [Micromonospora sicca]